VHQQDLDDRGLAHAYRAADLFVFPSLYEGFGMPILESFASGCPVVLAEASCFPEIAQDAALYFDPNDAEMMRDAITRGLRDRNLRRRLRELGAMRAAEFSWERTVHETFAVYRAVI
jgi:glycosyltransferase involved in cell wall biosynthesis